jgi:hypothetical protein
MACKKTQPHRCGECRYINHDAYRGAGKKVCYEIQRNANNEKEAVQVTESQKGCNNFIVAKKLDRVG